MVLQLCKCTKTVHTLNRRILWHMNYISIKMFLKRQKRGFPGGAVVKNPPANAGDTGLSPDPGRSHMLRSN